MARYTRSLSVASSLSDCLIQLKAVLESCNLEVLFSKEDCVIAREAPGQVPFAKLVTIEVLVDSTRATNNGTSLDVVVKNEELPLQTNNHCAQIFEQLSQALNQHSGWQVVGEDLTAVAKELSPPAVDNLEPSTSSTISTPSTPTQAEPDSLAPMSEVALSASLAPQTESESLLPGLAQPDQLHQTDSTSPQQSASQTIENNLSQQQQPSADSINLESVGQKRVQTTSNLEELRLKRAESVANLERLRQKRAESIANLEKMREKRERMFAANERNDTDDLDSVDLPEQPSTSQA